MDGPFLDDSERALVRRLADGDISVYERCKAIYQNKIAHLGEEFRYIAECFSDHPDKNTLSVLRRKILQYSEENEHVADAGNAEFKEYITR